MKKTLYLISAILMLASCVKPSDNSPEVSNPPHNIVSAAITGLSTAHVWSSGDLFGLYGSDSGTNVRYEVDPASFGKEGAARIFGPGAKGETLFGYYPFTKKGYPAVAFGRQPLPAEQAFQPNAQEQLKANTILVARLDESQSFSFNYLCGVLHIRTAVGVEGDVTEAFLLSEDAPLCGDYSILGVDPLMDNPGYKLFLRGVGQPCSQEKPLDFYFMLPPGTYTTLSINLVTASETVSKPIDASLSIVPRNEVGCTVTEKETTYEGTDIIIIDGSFDD